jgi:hypothetical protein
MPDRLTGMVAPKSLAVGYGQRFHLGEPLDLVTRGEPGTPVTPQLIPTLGFPPGSAPV